MTQEQDITEMHQIKRDKLDALIEAGKDPHKIEKFQDRTYSKDIIEKYYDFEGKKVRVAGRIMSKRGHGKVNFMDLQDAQGRIQLFNKVDSLGDCYEEVLDLDIGDIVGAEGEVFTTKAGEISIRTEKVTLLTKSLQILPEKYHGLKDQDLRYRQRYVDLIMKPEIKDVFITRSKVIKGIKKYLDERGFLEVETPVLNTIAGGANARPFITHHNSLDIDMYLRIANELYLKRLIVGGFDKVYEMGRMFRNEGMDATHNPEYTSIEVYAAYEDYEYIMDLTENLVHEVVKEVTGSSVIEVQGEKIDFTPPWNRIKMTDAIKKYSGVDLTACETDEEAVKLAKENNIEVEEHFTKGHIIEEFFDEFVEKNLIQPTFITHHPVEISPLSKRDPENPEFTHRFEAFCMSKEIANAFSELNDARDQKRRFEAQIEAAKKGDDEAHMMDYDFINALEVGLPPTGGLGIGVDRLVMLITGESSIRDVLLFPTMKPLDSEIKAKPAANEIKLEEETPVDFSKVVVEPLFEEEVDFDTFSKSDFRAVKVLNCEEVPKSKKLLKFTLDDGSGKERTILSGIKDNYSAEELIGKTLVAITNLPPRKMMGVYSEGMIISAIHEEEGKEKLNLLMLDHRIPAGAKMY